jgi:hypothetical protein
MLRTIEANVNDAPQQMLVIDALRIYVPDFPLTHSRIKIVDANEAIKAIAKNEGKCLAIYYGYEESPSTKMSFPNIFESGASRSVASEQLGLDEGAYVNSVKGISFLEDSKNKRRIYVDYYYGGCVK